MTFRYRDSTTVTVLEVPKQDCTQSRLTYLSRQIADPAKGCPKRTELMYGNTTAAYGERLGAVDKVVFSDIKKQPVVFTRPICKDLAV